MKNTIDINEKSGRDQISSLYANASETRDNEKYLIDFVRIDVDQLINNAESEDIVLVVVKKCVDGVHDLETVERYSEPFMCFILDDLGKAREFADFMVSHLREQPPFGEFWDHVCDYWEKL